MSAPTQTTQNICPPVERELGDTPLELMEDFRELAPDIAAQEEYSHALTAEALRTGEAARKTQADLGCASCELSGLCELRLNLDKRASAGEANQEVMAKAEMLAAAPRWLSAARLNLAGMTAGEAEALADAPEQLRQKMATGEIDLDRMLGDAQNELSGVVAKRDLPELNDIRGIKDDAQFEVTAVTTRNGDRFNVIDASAEVKFNGPSPSEVDYGVLNAKLLQRMSERGADGKPHILKPDFKMQKQLKGVPDGSSEIRMNGKNREYVCVTPGENGGPIRIIIFGCHGGNDQTQHDFINSLKG